MKTFDADKTERVSNQNHTSKGDQPKWTEKEYWYKADYMGYESFSEIVVSELMKKTNIENFVMYEPVKILFNGKELNGCVSENFKKNNENLVTLERLHRAYEGTGLAEKLSHFTDVKERIEYTVNFTKEKTKIEEFGSYLTMMLEIDALFLNEDRHTNNIAVIRNETNGTFRLCPYFDHGLSLMSDVNDYQLNKEIYDLISNIKSKPFSTCFDEQTDAAEELYGVQLKAHFTDTDIERLTEKFYGVYSESIVNRVRKILFEQRRKYSLFF